MNSIQRRKAARAETRKMSTKTTLEDARSRYAPGAARAPAPVPKQTWTDAPGWSWMDDVNRMNVARLLDQCAGEQICVIAQNPDIVRSHLRYFVETAPASPSKWTIGVDHTSVFVPSPHGLGQAMLGRSFDIVWLLGDSQFVKLAGVETAMRFRGQEPRYWGARLSSPYDGQPGFWTNRIPQHFIRE